MLKVVPRHVQKVGGRYGVNSLSRQEYKGR